MFAGAVILYPVKRRFHYCQSSQPVQSEKKGQPAEFDGSTELDYFCIRFRRQTEKNGVHKVSCSCSITIQRVKSSFKTNTQSGTIEMK